MTESNAPRRALPVLRKPDTELQIRWSGPRKVYDALNPPPSVGIDFKGDPGLTDPSHREDCDINTILDRATKTGVLPGTNKQALYGDFTSVPDYQEAQAILLHADAQFAALDAKARRRFDNSPSKMLEFMADPENLDEAIKLGLVTPSAQVPPSEAPLAPPTASGEVAKRPAPASSGAPREQSST